MCDVYSATHLGLMVCVLAAAINFKRSARQAPMPDNTVRQADTNLPGDDAIATARSQEKRYDSRIKSGSFDEPTKKESFRQTYITEIGAARHYRSTAMDSTSQDESLRTKIRNEYLSQAVGFCHNAAMHADENNDRSRFLYAVAEGAYILAEWEKPQDAATPAKMVLNEPEPKPDDPFGVDARHLAYRSLAAFAITNSSKMAECRALLLQWRQFNLRCPAQDDSMCLCLSYLGQCTAIMNNWGESLDWYAKLEKEPNVPAYWYRKAIVGEGKAPMNMARHESDSHKRKNWFTHARNLFTSVAGDDGSDACHEADKYLAEMKKNKEPN